MTAPPFPSNVFVLCTGRCGSTTLARACGHLTNWTSAHEGSSHLPGAARFVVPPRYVEIDDRPSRLPGRLDGAWGDLDAAKGDLATRHNATRTA